MDLVLDLIYFYFSNPNINPNPTHLSKHQTLSPNQQFSMRIWYAEYYCVHVHMALSQKLRRSEISLDACFCSLSNINILIVLVCLKLNGKWIKSRTQN